MVPRGGARPAAAGRRTYDPAGVGSVDPLQLEVVGDLQLLVLADLAVREVVPGDHCAGGIAPLERAVPGHEALPLAVGELRVEPERRVQSGLPERLAVPVEHDDAQVVTVRRV